MRTEPPRRNDGKARPVSSARRASRWPNAAGPIRRRAYHVPAVDVADKVLFYGQENRAPTWCRIAAAARIDGGAGATGRRRR
jgi:hypothetical protein